MNVLNRVTCKTLRRNRTRTLVTICGVILSAAMISAITTFIASMQNYMYEAAVASEGPWEVKIDELPGNRANLLTSDAEIQKTGLVRNNGYAVLEGCRNPDKPYLYFMDLSKEAFEMLPVTLLEGRMPEREGEVLLSQHISYNGGVEIAVGDVLTLPVGKRLADGTTRWQNFPYSDSSERITQTAETTVTVVGVCARPDFEPYSAPGYSVIGFWDAASLQPSDTLTAYLTVKNPREIYRVMERVTEQLGVSRPTYHGSILRAIGVSNNDSFNGVLYGMATILIVLIVVGSIALIYNAFAISVSERSRQFGMLAGAGATSRQISRSVLFEALVVGGIGIPIGILAGVAGIAVTLQCLQGALNSMLEMATSLGQANLRVVVSVPALVTAGAVALATVLVSAWFPARRASKTSAIDAVRQTTDVRLRPRQVRGNRLVHKLFGMEAELALKNFRRNRRRYRATILSLVISLVLFISVATFTETLREGAGLAYELSSADLFLYSSTDDAKDNDVLAEKIRGLSAVEDAVLYQNYSASVMLPASSLTKEAIANLKGTASQSAEGYRLDVSLIGMEDASFRSYAESLGLNAAEYQNASRLQGIVLDRYRSLMIQESSTSVNMGYILNRTPGEQAELEFYDYHYSGTGDEESSSPEETLPKRMETMDITMGYYTDIAPYGMEEHQVGPGILRIVMPLSLLENRPGAVGPLAYQTSVAVEAEDYLEAETQIEGVLSTLSDPFYLYNYADQVTTNRNLMLVINVFSYGFIVLISLISIANVFNTISTNIQLRRREFAMLKSVGMTPGGFRRMLNFECLFYGFKALAIGLPLSVLVSLWINATVASGVNMVYGLPWLHIGIAVVSVFFVVFVTMLYAMSKIRKENIVDQLRNENL